jgi:hypothetical protein
MWQRIRNWFSCHPTPQSGPDAEPVVEDVRLTDLHVAPDKGKGDDFDPEHCEQLLDTLVKRGAKTVGDVTQLAICVTLEEFFTGNRCKHSIAANVCPDPPYDTAESWFHHLKAVRDHERVQDVLVQIYLVEPYKGGRLGMWPYSDTIWIYSDLDQSTIESLLAPLDPDEVRDASGKDPNGEFKPPSDVPAGSVPYLVWWD